MQERTPTTEPSNQSGLTAFIRARTQTESQAAGSQQNARQRLQDLREVILRTLLIGSSVIGLLAYLLNLSALVENQSGFSIILYSLGLIGLLVLVFFTRIPYKIRSTTFLLILFTFGLNALTREGLHGNGRLYLLALPILASVLASERGRYFGLVLSIVGMVVMAVLLITGTIPPAASIIDGQNNSATTWSLATINFALLAIVTTLTSAYLIGALEIKLLQEASLSEDLTRERAQMEDRIQQRTVDLERRLLQIRTAAEISSTISSLLEIDILLPRVCELIKERFDLYYVGAFLLEELQESGDLSSDAESAEGLYAILRAGTGEAGRQMLEANHKLAVGGNSMIGWSTSHRQARIALDVGLDAVRFSNPYLPNTRSELALPILAKDKVLGALTIQSSIAEAFDEDDIIVLQGIADSLGSAIENARLFSEVQSSLKEIQRLHRQYLQRAWQDTLQAHEQLAYTYQAPDIQEAAGDPRTIRVPILLREQQIGNLVLEADPSASGPAPSSWSSEELSLIVAIADQAALALENARLLNETQQRAGQERIRASVTDKVWASTNVESILQTALEELGVSLGAIEGLIQLEINES